MIYSNKYINFVLQVSSRKIILMSLLVLLLLTMSAIAQDKKNRPLPKPNKIKDTKKPKKERKIDATMNKSYSVASGSNVSFPNQVSEGLSDGSLNHNLPLLSIGGRGDLSYSPTLNIRSDWSVETQFEEYDQVYYYYPQFLGTDDNDYGFYGTLNYNVGYGPGVLLFKREKLDNSYGPTLTLTRIYFKTSTGTIELRDSLFQGQTKNGANRGQHFVSNDGSAMTFISDTAVLDYASPPPISDRYPSGYLKFADGTTYRIDNGLVSFAKDRNGNQMSFSYLTPTYSSPVISSVTDSNGRTVQFEYNVQEASPYGLSDKITYQGFGGATRIVHVSKTTLGNALRSGETLKDLTALFPNSDSYGGTFNPTVISKVWLPDGRSHKFLYNSYGELARLESPTGAIVEYDHIGYGEDEGGFWRGYPDDNQNACIYRQLNEKRTYLNNTTLLTKDTFQFESNWGSPYGYETLSTIETFDGQSGAKLSKVKHYFYGNTLLSMLYAGVFNYPYWKDGREYKTEILDINNNVLFRNEMDWQQRAHVSWYNPIYGYFDPPVDVRLIEKREIDVVSNLVAKTSYGYDEFNNVTDKWEYDYGTGQAGSLLRYTHTDFVKGSYIDNFNVSSPHLRRLPWQSWVSSDAQGNNKGALTLIEYDNYTTDSNHAALLSRVNVVGHDSNYGATKIDRGNITKVTNYTEANSASGPISVYSQYDILGNTVKSIDAKGVASLTNYLDNYGFPDGESRNNSAPSQLNGLNTFAFPSNKTQALGFTAYVQFDYWTGSIVNTEDINGNISKMIYNDPFDRLTQAVSSVGTPNEIQSNTVYDDINGRVETKKDLYNLNDNLQRSESFSDSLGRVYETKKYDSNGFISTKTEYDVLGRVKRISNPYRQSQNEPIVWTETFYDWLGRLTSTKTPDNAVSTTSYSGNTVTTTDQTGRTRRTITNAAGQLVRVDEPNNQGDLGTINNPAQPTSYFYNVLGKPVKITQGGQNRFFLYNSLGQLIRARQPEQASNPNLTLSDSITGNSLWSESATYDPNGNKITAVNANNVLTTNSYDIMNRIVSVTYNDGTPSINYTYENSNIPFSKDKLTKVTNGISTTDYTSFNSLGMILTHTQTIDNQAYPTSYKYDLSGNITEQTYPSGRVIKSVLDSNGALAAITSQKTLGSPIETYASEFNYTTIGGIKSLKLGNGLYETTQFNYRLQITEQGLGFTTVDTSLWKVNYDYGNADNNGNVKAQIINAGGAVFTQINQYDSLNRLTETQEISGGQQTWKQNFGYDRFGNRTQFSQIIGSNQLPINSQTLPLIDYATNRFTSGQGYEFDSNGNLTRDYEGRQFTFNAEDKQVLVKDVNNQVIGQYFYDGTGKRVKKLTATEAVIFIYNAVGQLVAEYSTNTPSGQPSKVSYLTNDILGTPRITTDPQKQVISRRDFLPFGEELTRANYGNDSVRQKFTGYERDNETGLDFAQARMYANRFGRFVGIDPVGPNLKNPQTLNRYQYCFNNPIRCFDKSGGYGRDVHMALTMALAYAAGFSGIDALRIGLSTQNPDDDERKNPLPFFNDVARSQYHFTTEERRNDMWSIFTYSSGNSRAWGYRGPSVWEALGDYLHAQQDSYSHDGFGPWLGQAPSGFRNWKWARIWDWADFYHEAEQVDVTINDPKKAEEMAQFVFDRLLIAREIMGRNNHLSSDTLIPARSPLNYEDIKDAVMEFIKAKKDTEEEIQVASKKLWEAIIEIQEREAKPDTPYR